MKPTTPESRDIAAYILVDRALRDVSAIVQIDTRNFARIADAVVILKGIRDDLEAKRHVRDHFQPLE